MSDSKRVEVLEKAMVEMIKLLAECELIEDPAYGSPETYYKSARRIARYLGFVEVFDAHEGGE